MKLFFAYHSLGKITIKIFINGSYDTAKIKRAAKIEKPKIDGALYVTGFEKSHNYKYLEILIVII